MSTPATKQANLERNKSDIAAGMRPSEYDIPAEYHYTLYDPKYYDKADEIREGELEIKEEEE